MIGAAGDTVSGRKVKPTERRHLGPWLADPALVSQWDVLVAAKGDRISLERIEYWAELGAWVVAHGKTLVVVERGGVFFPPRHEGDTYNWAGIKSMAGNEWDVIRGRIVQSHFRIMRDGYWVGRAPFGYRIEGDRYRKTLVPAATADYVPGIYSRAISGDSLQKLADWLTVEGVPTESGNAVWNASVVRQVLANATYSGTHTRTCAECGGSHHVTVPALVDMATQRRAADALRSRVRGSNNGGRPSAAPAMLVPVCNACDIPIYRIVSNVKGHRYEHYYCKRRATGGVRRGCGLMLRCDLVDTLADRSLSANPEPETVVAITYPAAALESEIERVRRAERSAFEADDIEKVLELRAQREALEADLATAEREHVEKVPVLDAEGKPRTVGHTPGPTFSRPSAVRG